MSADETIFNRLTSLVAGKVAPRLAPQHWQPPFIVYQRLATEGFGALVRDAGLFTAQYQFRCHASQQSAARTLARQVRGRLGIKTDVPSDGIRVGVFVEEIDFVEPPSDGQERSPPVVLLTMALTFRDPL